MALVTIPEERQRLELQRAAHGEYLAREDRRAGYRAGAVMVGTILLQYLMGGLAMHLSGPMAWRFYTIALLLGPLPMLIAVMFGARRD